mmetsp:Transcript_28385/g.92700  ORF Transcript_28385/g.92700 Transcript_28385/m.92700 type:complete len:448 (+) Transcript_28385:16-1359(+)
MASPTSCTRVSGGLARGRSGLTRAQRARGPPPTPVISPQRETAAETIEASDKYIVGTYVRPEIVFTHGEGSLLFDSEGKEYLDFTAGIAVNALGHSDASWVAAVQEQAAKLTHVSNLFHTEPGPALAKRLCESAPFADRVFFCNSGAEANEAAFKFARKRAAMLAADDGTGGAHATGAVAFSNAFHGRTMGALALTWKEGYRKPFEPLPTGVEFAEYGNLESAAEHIRRGETAAVFVEPVQGEGGIYPANIEFLQGLRKLCDDAGAALIFDEVQCGLGRTGALWAHLPADVKPDMMTVAKPLAGGLPIGACLVTEEVNSALAPGDHGSTFAGGPLVCHAALAVMDRVEGDGFLDHVSEMGERLRAGLRAAVGDSAHVREVRGAGLLVGVQLDCAAGPLVVACREAGLLVITAGAGDVLRLVPPLTVSAQEVDRAVDLIAKCFPALDQ